MTSKKKISFALAAVILGQMALPAMAQDGNVLTRTVDSLPVNSGGNAANAVTGEDTFKTTATAGAETVRAVPAETPAATESEEDIAAALENGEANEAEVEKTSDDEAPEQDRVYDIDGDPITQAATMLLDNSGVIGRQRAVAESILMMDEQIKHQRKIEEALTALGPDTPIEVSPGVFKTFEGTPAAIRARISYIKLKQQLAETLNSGATVDTTGGVNVVLDEPAPLPVRDDGTGFQEMNPEVVVEGTGNEVTEPGPDVENRLDTLLLEAEKRLAKREAEILETVEKSGAKIAAEAEAEAEAEKVASIENVSVREIYGSHGVFTSVVDIAGERQEIKIGDTIADGYTVKRIASDSVELTKDGQSTRLSF